VPSHLDTRSYDALLALCIVQREWLDLDASAKSPSLRHNQPLLLVSTENSKCEERNLHLLIKKDVKPSHAQIGTKTVLQAPTLRCLH
jgi:hypothetical protein